jgi:Oxysterol-binding protein
LAADEADPMRRIALVAIYMITSQTVAEKSLTKPFNPLLGETYEFSNDKFDLLCEQVSHHPPICATYVRGKHWTMFSNNKPNISFNGKMLKIQ